MLILHYNYFKIMFGYIGTTRRYCLTAVILSSTVILRCSDIAFAVIFALRASYG